MKTISICQVLALLTLPPLINGCGKKGCTDSNSYNYNLEATKDDETCVSMSGCLGYSSSYNNIGSLGSSFYDAENDYLFANEVGVQVAFWDIPATVYVWYEPQGVKNAVSTSQGKIMYGYNLFYYTVPNFGDNAVDGILAHEWAHQIQFNYGWHSQGTLLSELEADAFAGFYIAAKKQWNTSLVQGFINGVYNNGSYNFTDPDFHGTPNQRSAAALYGIEVGIDFLNGATYSYTTLHNKFISKIKSDILRVAEADADTENTADTYIGDIARGKGKMEEIVYPEFIKNNKIAK